MIHFIENVVGILFLISLVISVMDNYKIYQNYKKKYGKPKYRFIRSNNYNEFGDYLRWFTVICIYQDFIVTKYSGKDIIIDKNANVELKRYFMGRLVAVFEIKTKDNELYILKVGENALKRLKQFFNI